MALSLILNQEGSPSDSFASTPPSRRCTPSLSDVEGPTERPERPAKKQKVAKDAAMFVQHEVRGLIRYKPWEDYDAGTERELQRWKVHPLHAIAKYHRHIPYSGNKSNFEEKTGRKAFEVFQYTFTMPGTDNMFVVMWDYNIGLVRITPFFKSLGHGKTVPSKAIDGNEGLRELCFSITGGALAAQGYWMPYEAARAMAQTFCYQIRFALAPVFGPDFIQQCIRPDEEGYERSRIDPRIVKRCARQAEEYLKESQNIAPRDDSRPEGSNSYGGPGSDSASSTPPPRVQHHGGIWRAVNSELGYNSMNEMAGTNSDQCSTSYSPISPSRSVSRQLPTLPGPSAMLTHAALSVHDGETFSASERELRRKFLKELPRHFNDDWGVTEIDSLRARKGSGPEAESQQILHIDRVIDRHRALAQLPLAPTSGNSHGMHRVHGCQVTDRGGGVENGSPDHGKRERFSAAWTLMKIANEPWVNKLYSSQR